MKQLDQALEIYRSGKVVRIHGAPGHRTENTSEHSHGVAMWLALYYPSCSAAMLKAALFHDLPEYVTGDIPSTMMKKYPEVAAACAQEEDAFYERNGIPMPYLTENEKLVLYAADKFDFAMWCYLDFLLGNKNVEVYVERTKRLLYEIEEKLHDKDDRAFINKLNTLIACILQEMRK